MQFKDIISQDEVKQHLVEMVQHNRLSHALLFLGKEGSGALPLAMAFAQYISLLPASSGREGEANAQKTSLFGEAIKEVEVRLPQTADEADAYMNKQTAFSKAQGMVHPDIHYTYPVVTKKTGSPPVSADYITEW